MQLACAHSCFVNGFETIGAGDLGMNGYSACASALYVLYVKRCMYILEFSSFLLLSLGVFSKLWVSGCDGLAICFKSPTLCKNDWKSLLLVMTHVGELSYHSLRISGKQKKVVSTGRLGSTMPERVERRRGIKAASGMFWARESTHGATARITYSSYRNPLPRVNHDCSNGMKVGLS